MSTVHTGTSDKRIINNYPLIYATLTKREHFSIFSEYLNGQIDHRKRSLPEYKYLRHKILCFTIIDIYKCPPTSYGKALYEENEAIYDLHKQLGID